MSRADQTLRRLAVHRRQLDAATEEVEGLEARLKAAQADQRHWGHAQSVLQEAAQAVQSQAHRQIADVVTECLAAVFPDAPSFKIEFDRKRGKTEARMVFLQDGEEIDPMEAGSLGMVDVASLALRVSCLKLHSPPVAQVLILDEPMRWVGKTSKVRVAELLERLSADTGVQFIIASHDTEFRVGNVIDLGD